MRLEDTIRTVLFRTYAVRYAIHSNNGDFAIECKAESGKPIPLCFNRRSITDIHLAYRRLYLEYPTFQERSTPRALYNLMFGNYQYESLCKYKIKDTYYYYACGVLFNADKEPLFYFAKDYQSDDVVLPRLYITPKLLANSVLTGYFMEKFFMSTIIPYLVNNRVCVNGNYYNTIIEIDNHVNDTFFLPGHNMITSVSADKVNSMLNDILANNADTLSSFICNIGSSS